MAAASSTRAEKRISFTNMPVINLTQSAGPSNHRMATSSSSRVDGTGSNGENNVGAEPAKKYRKVVPRPEDESSTICVLSGNTVSGYIELCGWSLFTPLKFFNIRESTHLHSMTDGRGEVISAAEELQKKCITLREMEQLIGGPNQVVSCPVFVHVVAKRKVDVIPHQKNRILIISSVVIADKSGYCVICSFNEGMATIYNEVEVGDLLLISKCLPQIPRRTYHKGLFSDDMFINMELKLQFHSVRQHYIWKFTPINLRFFVMPESLFDSFCQVKLPSDLEKEFKNPPAKLPGWIVPPFSQQYYDLVGVIVYVGRMERFMYMEKAMLDCVEDGKIVTKSHSRYLLCRWIYLVDLTSQIFPVKAYVHNATIDHQRALVPGAILSLTHCQTVDCPFSGKYTATSHFSQIYVAGNIEKYYMLHPDSFRPKVKEMLTKRNYVEVMSRTDIQLCIGGTHCMKIQNPEKFIDIYTENRNKSWNQTNEDKPMQRRESRRLYFDGTILRVIEIKEEGVAETHKPSQRFHVEKEKKNNKEYKVIENFYPYRQHKNTSWFAFQRKLPAYDPFHLQQEKCRNIVKKIVETYKPYCSPLLIPADIPDYKEDSAPEMSSFEKVDGPPYLILDIVCEEKQVWYTCIWKTRQYSFQEMLDKVTAADNKKVICVADVYCTEQDAPLEVNLADFVVYDE